MNFAMVALLSSLTVTPGPTVRGPEQLSLFEVEHRIVQRTNERRIQHGLTPLAIDMNLMRSARQHTAWMARNGVMQHAGSPVAENIAVGQRTASDVVRSWMNSSGHRANILQPAHRRIGVAAFQGSGGRVYWCQQFLQ